MKKLKNKNHFILTHFNDYLDYIEKLINQNDSNNKLIILYRGQCDDWELLPSVARINPHLDSTVIETNMLNELRRRRPGVNLNHNLIDDWDWLVYAQHYGLKTRLLDWTSNPLAALWFGLAENTLAKAKSYVYIFANAEDFILDKASDPSPFKILKTRILKPSMNNERIVAQSGWFTAHKFSTTSNKFVAIEEHRELKKNISIIEIPVKLRKDIIRKLDMMGVNFQSLFPDITGVCKQINWEFEKQFNIH